ncbi:MAG: alpha/beta hydrolase [Roseofilum sp. SBFL]|uniref:alpha/beta hydrolase n=1 Tax=unclassified Roseofilum TaxID=2620099 RepID=UPI001B299B69|nr:MULTISPECIES: alpha/beta hydrolase [unclassified Roseofilum]MBP0013224.1 alpha/beta hydrolase [Roseofilum sp. SID3]MBP0025988.1 alpha/beta hydrolase [Roseofilum sp. SID2]MBP0037857.1 alpha/beta hydrolase [Roseofilum sp. SID1]MBP0041917.1 alpha/beta hydrolase [Roseofilum sp. SBFL]
MVLQQYFRWQWLMGVAMLVCSPLPLEPVWAAEQVYVSFSLVERSIPVRDLENFVNEGKISPKLSAYTRYLNEDQLNQFREILQQPIDVTPLGISQFLYSPQGEVLLERLGRVVKTGGRQQGFYAIRAALILAAAEPDGMTLLNILRKFPTQGLRIDLESALDIALNLYTLVQQTNEANQVVAQQSAIEVSFQSQLAKVPEGIQWNSAFPFSVPKGEIPISELPDLDDVGYFRWEKRSFTLRDRERNRAYPVDLYVPNRSDQPAPLVVISHGLGSNRESFVYLATHLASRGFAVVVPEHLESSDRQREAMLEGKANEVAEPSEFINRPLDIIFMLDELSRQTQPGGALEGRINVDRVGAIGQSFGGYTVLALAGAKINFEQLEADCNPNSPSWNVSLLLQCRALELGEGDRSLNLQDSRIQSVIAINPISSRVLGESSLDDIQIPVMIVAGSKDTVALSFPEQILPFVWLTNTSEKYLVLQEGGTHFSTLQPGEDDLPLPSLVIGEDPDLARRYTLALTLAFFQTYVAENLDYKPYLTPAYIQSISQEPMPLSLVTQLELEQLPEISPGF